MPIRNSHILPILLLLSGLILSALVPGGPIENRDFSHINPAILLTFNVYLTILGLGSFILVAYVYKRGTFAGLLSMLAGVSYLVVYGVDLAGWFPKTPSPMSDALLWAEMVGLLLAIPMIRLSILLSRQGEDSARVVWGISRARLIALVFGATAIVTFATWSAMAPAT
jgi:hypothetical protein